MADDVTRRRGRDPEAVRDDILRTRAEIDETVAALGERLAPGRLIGDAWHRLRGEGEDTKGVGEVFKDHPVPFALMGLGLGWLAIEQATGRSVTHGDDSPVGPGTWAPAEGRRGPYLGDAVQHDDPDWAHAGPGDKAKETAGQVKDKAAHAKERVDEAMEAAGELKDRAAGAASSVAEKAKHAARSATEGVSDAAEGSKERVRSAVKGAREAQHHLRERASERLSRTAREAKHGARVARRRTRDLIEEHPLAASAVAFGLAVVGAASTRTTRTEDRAMGGASDTLKDEARRVTRESRDKARHVAEEAAMAATEEIERQTRSESGPAHESVEAARESVSRAGDAAADVARAAGEAAERTAEEEDLTATDMQDEARRAAERTARQAKEDVRETSKPPRP